jgi:hypothetical protein
MPPMDNRLLRPRAASGFDLRRIAGLALWYDAADSGRLFDATTGGSGVAADGAVARWEDKSGNGKHLTQGTLNNRPIRKAAARNGRDVLLFDGNDDILKVDMNQALAQPVTVLMVFRIVANPGSLNGRIFHSSSAELSETNAAIFAVNGTANDHVINFGTNVSVSVGRDTNWHQWLLSVDGASTTIRQDAVQIGTTFSPGANSVNRYLSVGGRYHDNLRLLNTEIGEIAFFSRLLSADERARVEGYTFAKWGV